MTPTRPRLLVAVGAVAAAAGWSVAAVVDAAAGRYLPLSLSAAAAMWLLAIAVGMWGWIIRPRLLRRPGREPLPPIVAARTAALALAGSRVGAGVAGCYAGIAVFLLPDLAVEAARSGAVSCAVTVLGSAGLVAASLWVERMCRLPQDGDGDDAAGDAGSTLGGIAGSTERTGQ